MMKRILSLALVWMLLLGSALAAPGTQLGFDALPLLYAEGKNCIISPLSLGYALSMAAQGAQGDTRAQMLALLEAESPSDIAASQEALSHAGIKLANAAFLAGDLVPKKDYTRELNDIFDAEWFENKGNVVKKINKWVDKVTDGQIDRILSGPLPENSALMLVNALCMQARWRTTFSEYSTYAETFHAAGGEVEADFMHKTAHYTYGERDGVQLLRLDYVGEEYENTGLHMLIALPEAGGIADVLAGLQAQGLSYFSFNESAPEVRLSMPKMDISVDLSLAETLKALGMELAFAPAADFSGIAEQPMWIDEVIQKVRVQVDEQGTKAAAATLVAMVAGAAAPMAKPEPIEMKLDRPFVFLIVEEESQSVCFAGVIENPLG